MSTNNSNIINGYDLVQAKSALPQFIQCSTRYKELSQLFSQTEYQETLLDIITTTIKRIRRYQSSKVIDLARLVKLLYGIQKHDSIKTDSLCDYYHNEVFGAKDSIYQCSFPQSFDAG